MHTQRDSRSLRRSRLTGLLLGLAWLSACSDDAGAVAVPAGPGCTLTTSGALSVSSPCDAWLEPGTEAGTYSAHVFAQGATNFTFGVTGIGVLQKQMLRFPTLALNQYASAALVQAGATGGWIMSTQTPMIGFFELAIDESDPASGDKWPFRGTLDVRLDSGVGSSNPSVRVHVTIR